jgi:4-diphosphocytidyl-2-C-methyl-D-erythritol kinase
MTALRDVARAKLNLTLEVLGRRADGFHELQSLVAFTALGDTVELTPGDGLELVVEGPFAGALSGDNLIIRAAESRHCRSPPVLAEALPMQPRPCAWSRRPMAAI